MDVPWRRARRRQGEADVRSRPARASGHAIFKNEELLRAGATTAPKADEPSVATPRFDVENPRPADGAAEEKDDGPWEYRTPPLVDLPRGIKACPACGMLIEKISARSRRPLAFVRAWKTTPHTQGDNNMMCGTKARAAGGTYRQALAGGGCGHEFDFQTLAPRGQGRLGEPMNDRQIYFKRHRVGANAVVDAS